MGLGPFVDQVERGVQICDAHLLVRRRWGPGLRGCHRLAVGKLVRDALEPLGLVQDGIVGLGPVEPEVVPPLLVGDGELLRLLRIHRQCREDDAGGADDGAGAAEAVGIPGHGAGALARVVQDLDRGVVRAGDRSQSGHNGADRGVVVLVGVVELDEWVQDDHVGAELLDGFLEAPQGCRGGQTLGEGVDAQEGADVVRPGAHDAAGDIGRRGAEGAERG